MSMCASVRRKYMHSRLSELDPGRYCAASLSCTCCHPSTQLQRSYRWQEAHICLSRPTHDEESPNKMQGTTQQLSASQLITPLWCHFLRRNVFYSRSSAEPLCSPNEQPKPTKREGSMNTADVRNQSWFRLLTYLRRKVAVVHRQKEEKMNSKICLKDVWEKTLIPWSITIFRDKAFKAWEVMPREYVRATPDVVWRPVSMSEELRYAAISCSNLFFFRFLNGEY